MPNGINATDSQEMGNETSSAGATRSHPYSSVSNHVDHFGDGEEIPGKPETCDGSQFGVESMFGLASFVFRVAVRYRCGTSVAQ